VVIIIKYSLIPSVGLLTVEISSQKISENIGEKNDSVSVLIQTETGAVS